MITALKKAMHFPVPGIKYITIERVTLYACMKGIRDSEKRVLCKMEAG